MRTEDILRLLDERRTAIARDALAKPQDRDSFEYGRVVGLYAGLQMAEDVLMGFYRDQERKQFDL